MQVLRFLLHSRTRWVICWFIFLASAGFSAVAAWRGFNQHDRADGNRGHATIDFGGQWLMGRMIVEGHGRQLYRRDYLRLAAQKSYPKSDENPEAPKSDAESMMDWLAGTDDPEAPDVIASLLAPLSANNLLDETVVLASAQTTWTEERLTHATTERIGGGLYPPIHALYFAPLALLRPQPAYRVMQCFILVMFFFVGWVAQRMTEGRVWWPVASLLVLMFPGFAGCITLGQNGILVLMLVLVGWWQLMRGREVLAGLCWGLLAFKPVWAASFFFVPLLTARWRMTASMAAAGLVQIAVSLPFVGWETWWNWLQVGQLASEEYRRQENWIFLSRDLIGIPRRWLLTFEGGLAKDLVWKKGDLSIPEDSWTVNPWNDPLLSVICWGLWAIVLAVTLFVVWRRREQRKELTGLFPAFVLCGAIFSCYHFMYYDFLVAGLPVLLLFTEPSRYFQVRFWRRSGPRPFEHGDTAEALRRYHQPSLDDLTPPPMPLLPEGRHPRWVFAPTPPLLLFLMLAAPALAALLDPSYHFPPWETLILLVLWGWCGYRLMNPSRATPLPHDRGSSLRIKPAQLAELDGDVGRTHERLADQHGADAGRS